MGTWTVAFGSHAKFTKITSFKFRLAPINTAQHDNTRTWNKWLPIWVKNTKTLYILWKKLSWSEEIRFSEFMSPPPFKNHVTSLTEKEKTNKRNIFCFSTSYTCKHIHLTWLGISIKFLLDTIWILINRSFIITMKINIFWAVKKLMFK